MSKKQLFAKEFEDAMSRVNRGDTPSVVTAELIRIAYYGGKFGLSYDEMCVCIHKIAKKAMNLTLIIGGKDNEKT